MAATPINYGHDFSGLFSEPNGTSKASESDPFEYPAILFEFDGFAEDPLRIVVSGMNDDGTPGVWKCTYHVVHESGVFVDLETGVLPLDGLYQIVVLPGYDNPSPGVNQDLFQGHLYLPATLTADPAGQYVIGEPIKLTPVFPERFSATLPGFGPLMSGVPVLDFTEGGTQEYVLTVSGGGSEEQILVSVDQDGLSIVPGEIESASSNGEEWHLFGRGGDEVLFDLKSDGNDSQIFGLSLSPLNRDGSSIVEWTRTQWADIGKVLHFRSVLPKTGVYRLWLVLSESGLS